MTNNDVLRYVSYAFELDVHELSKIFSLADFAVQDEQLSCWLKKESDGSYLEFSDKELALFLNGFINYKRGKLDGVEPRNEEIINNNIVFQKLRIALNLKAEDILEILQLEDFRLSKHELSAFFRKPDNKHYRECKDHVLKAFLRGLEHPRGGNTGS
ncbi:DUF1456 family protein [Plesiomonas shigelloides]|uniref:DUF1456 family protein n=1 Tax=Plesiomonas shigelloides TaxID=703 RepID=UPI001262862D|nr:DUF1456 family protein [Plesiomonas shigelloides]KAB7692230.1 DUF1456 family protein [Plesiomonas shigelloides]